MNLRRYFFTLLVVLPLSSPLSAQETDEDDKFYLDFAGSAVFPYNPKGQLGHGVKAGAGFTAAFGYAFKEGFSTEIEWGHQKVGIGNPTGPGGTIGAVVSIGDGWTDSEVFLPPPITIEIDGEIKTQSLMGNFYYRYPKWKVSPYAGFGLGAFFHDGAVTSGFEYHVPPGVIDPGVIIITEVLNPPVAYEDSRFAYQIMVGLSVRVSPLLEFHTGYRFRSSRGAEIDADCIEAGIRFRF